MTILIARNDDPGGSRYAVVARSAGDGATQTACGASLDCFAVARNDDPGYSVIARSDCDEAIKAASAEQIWIASLSLAMTIREHSLSPAGHSATESAGQFLLVHEDCRLVHARPRSDVLIVRHRMFWTHGS